MWDMLIEIQITIKYDAYMVTMVACVDFFALGC